MIHVRRLFWWMRPTAIMFFTWPPSTIRISDGYPKTKPGNWHGECRRCYGNILSRIQRGNRLPAQNNTGTSRLHSFFWIAGFIYTEYPTCTSAKLVWKLFSLALNCALPKGWLSSFTCMVISAETAWMTIADKIGRQSEVVILLQYYHKRITKALKCYYRNKYLV